jgi:hypothetical protein
MRHYEPEHVAYLLNQHVAMIAWKIKHQNGLLDRIDAAVAKGERVHDTSLAATYLDDAANTLRTLADLCEQRHQAITAMPCKWDKMDGVCFVCGCGPYDLPPDTDCAQVQRQPLAAGVATLPE